MNTKRELKLEEMALVTGGRKHLHCSIPEDTRRELKEAVDTVLDFFGTIAFPFNALTRFQ